MDFSIIFTEADFEEIKQKYDELNIRNEDFIFRHLTLSDKLNQSMDFSSFTELKWERYISNGEDNYDLAEYEVPNNIQVNDQLVEPINHFNSSFEEMEEFLNELRKKPKLS